MQQIYLNETILNISNKSFYRQAFLNGDSIFTSSAIIDGKVPWWDDHLDRILTGINNYFFLNTLKQSDLVLIQKRIEKVLFEIKNIKKGYLRITFFPNCPLSFEQSLDNINQLDCLWNIEEKNIDSDIKKCKLLDLGNIKYPNNLKMGSYAIEKYWRRKVFQENFNDYLRIENNNILEASTSNVFFILKDESIVTPKLQEGVLDGTTRKNLIKYFRAENIIIDEKIVDKNILNQVKEVFLTNAVMGIIPVTKVDQFSFKTEQTLKLKQLWPWGLCGKGI